MEFLSLPSAALGLLGVLVALLQVVMVMGGKEPLHLPSLDAYGDQDALEAPPDPQAEPLLSPSAQHSPYWYVMQVARSRQV